MPSRTSRFVFGSLLLLLLSPLVNSQHTMHNMGGTGGVELQTMPADDDVLAAAPNQIMLHFGSELRLVKLALRNTDNELIDIGFRYNPDPGRDFMQPLPALPADDYYRVEWGIVDANGELVRGMFHFSFGANARPPSYWLDQMEQMRHIMAPDYRLLQQNPQ